MPSITKTTAPNPSRFVHRFIPNSRPIIAKGDAGNWPARIGNP
jgi:hypothetical protein